MNEKKATYMVNSYGECILRIGYTWFGNIYDAEDVCQTVLMKLMDDEHTFDDKGQERAWVIRITINTCKNLKKSFWFRRTVGLEDAPQLVAEDVQFEEDGLLALVQQLPLHYRKVIYLHYYEEYAVKEIGEILQQKPALVSTHLARARAKLKKMIGDTDYGKSIQTRVGETSFNG